MNSSKKLFVCALILGVSMIGSAPATASDLVITGVIDGPLSGGVPKAIELYATTNIADLSIYGIGSANNGGGSDGEEFTFPADAVTAGSYIYVASESTGFTSFFGFAPDYTSGAASINGDDAIELFQNAVIADVFGDINVDGSGQPWEYLDGWAYRVDATGPDGGVFDLANWTFSGPDALEGETTNGTAATPFPIGTYAAVETSNLLITGVVDADLPGGLPKAIEFYVTNDIADLSIYGFGSANNGGGSDGEEFTFPAAFVAAGTYLYVASEAVEFANFFGFAPDYTSGAASINGDDAIELFFNGAVADVFGDINVDGNGEPWEYLDGWAYRVAGTGPDGSTFVLANWTFSGPGGLDGETPNGTAANPFPLGTYDAPPPAPAALLISGVVDADLPGGLPKAIEFYAFDDIADLSTYGFGSANNGGGSDGEEFTFPAGAVTAGTYIYVASEAVEFANFFGFAPDHTSSAAGINGDDAIELFQNGAVIDVFGDINVDGNGEPWEYLDGWAYRVGGTGPDGSTFVLANWTFSGPGGLDGETTNGTAANPFPLGSYDAPPPAALLISGVVDADLPGGLPKAIEFFAFDNIADLSAYGFGSANNGGGSDGQEFTFPAVAVSAGSFIYVASEAVEFANFFGFAPDYTSGAASINGDDAIELFQDGSVIDVFGDINVDGSGEPWEYADGWAYRVDSTGPDGSTFVLGNWFFSGPGGLDGETTNATAADPFPIGSYLGSGENPPRVDSTSPANGAIATVDTNIVITFSEDVAVTGSWFDITCTVSGGHSASVSGGPQTFTLDPDVDFDDGESCTVTVFAAGVSDLDTDDPPDNPTMDVAFTFSIPLEVEIYEIQGSGAFSPFVGQAVTTRDNVVTGVTNNGFFIQTPDARSDADAGTSDGIFVFTGGSVAVGAQDLVDVTGTIVEFFDFTEVDDNGLIVTVTASGAALPTPILLDAANPLPGPFDPSDLERFEGMVVRLENGLINAATDRFGDTAAVVGPNRVLREAGIEFPGLPGLPEWDANQELFEIDPDGLVGMPDLELFSLTEVVEADGPLAFSFGDYQILPSTLVVGPDPALPTAVRARDAGELTIASQNMLRLFDDQDDPGTGEPVLTTAEFQDLLVMFSEHFRLNLGSPDIIAFQEVENLNVLQQLALQIAADGGPTYSAHLIEGNDVGGIDVGYLTDDATVLVNSVDQFGETLTLSVDGSLLHDRPPLVLDATYIGGGASFPLTVINVHQRSLSGIEDPGSNGVRVKTKRLEQAETLAGFIQSLQTGDPDIRLVVTGDFNAYQFTDGYVDVLGVLSGNLDPAGAEFPGSDLIDPNLTNEILSLPVEEQYSFIFDGNPQALDHVLTSVEMGPFVSGVEYARGNSDAPASLVDDVTTTLRASDHDGLVLYIKVDSDLDGVPDAEDLCPDTMIPEDVPTRFLLPFRYALVDGDTTFDTKKPWWFHGTLPTFTTEDTAGCGCEQILDALGLPGNFSRKYGCGLWLMNFWVQNVNP